MAGVVIVGGGVAGVECAAALRRGGYPGDVTILAEERHAPYQRPPLSKRFLHGEVAADRLALQPPGFYSEHGIDLRAGVRAAGIDRAARELALHDGTALRYDHLVLATGARERVLPGAEGVSGLRTLDDAIALRERMRSGGTLAVVGGGFIGLEVASVACGAGMDVVVIEALDRLMARVASAPLAEHLRALHEHEGVRVRLGRRVAGIADGVVALDDGDSVTADVVLAGIGVRPDDDLARAAGLPVDDGVLVDASLVTADEHISAIGDCARFPYRRLGRLLRLESIQNATDQARCVAARLTGDAAPYDPVPWFWTEQHGQRVQIAGVAPEDALDVRRAGGEDPARWSVCRFAAGRLVAVESVDHVQDHVAARKLLAGEVPVSPDAVADPAVALRDLAMLVA